MLANRYIFMVEQPAGWPNRIISGGQVGVDRAALDWAMEHDVPHGGWCPQGRRAIDGELPARYQLQEADSPSYAKRTRLNVRDSDATLIINQGALDGGTRLTVKCAEQLGKPHLCVQVDEDHLLEALANDVRRWLREGRFHTLNVAGPRETKRPGIYAITRLLLDWVLIGTGN
jgi:Circularly permutated YpsA SLOG family